MQLAARCELCSSWKWCGRPLCKNAPAVAKPTPVKPRKPRQKPQDAFISTPEELEQRNVEAAMRLGPAGGAERVKRWRAANRELYNAYMRQWRARQKPPQ